MPAINLAGSGQALDTSIPTIYEEFRLIRDETGVCRAAAFAMPMKPHTGTTKNIINYGRLVGYDLADGVDMVQHQNLSDTLTSFTPGEVGVQLILPRTTLRRIADPDLLRRTGKLMATAYDVKEDNDGTAQFTSWVPIVGSAGLIMGPGYFQAGIMRLGIGNDRTNPENPPEPWISILHPLHVGGLMGNTVPFTDVPTGTTRYTGLTATGGVVGPGRSGDWSDEYLRGGPPKGPKETLNYLGIKVYRDANIDVDSGDDASGCIFSKDGFIYVSEWEPEMMNEDMDKSLRAIELNLIGSYAFGLYRSSNYGVEFLFDASLPTG